MNHSSSNHFHTNKHPFYPPLHSTPTEQTKQSQCIQNQSRNDILSSPYMSTMFTPILHSTHHPLSTAHHDINPHPATSATSTTNIIINNTHHNLPTCSIQSDNNISIDPTKLFSIQYFSLPQCHHESIHTPPLNIPHAYTPQNPLQSYIHDLPELANQLVLPTSPIQINTSQKQSHPDLPPTSPNEHQPLISGTSSSGEEEDPNDDTYLPNASQQLPQQTYQKQLKGEYKRHKFHPDSSSPPSQQEQQHHEQYHLKLSPSDYICTDLNGNQFNLKDWIHDIQEEMRISKTPLVIPCPFEGCDKTFEKLYNLKSHIVCHLDTKPHTCHHCSSSFRRSHDLRRHIRSTHSKEKPFQCHICGKCFARKDHYQRHLNIEAKHGRS